MAANRNVCRDASYVNFQFIFCLSCSIWQTNKNLMKYNNDYEFKQQMSEEIEMLS